MTRGKKTCKILKEIRTQIAKKNDIEYVTSECEFQGECKGTCPKCEAEVRYLENELRKRQQLGKVVTIAGISLGVAGTFAACSNSAQQSDEKNSQVEDTVKVAQHSSVSINTDSITLVPPPDLVTISDYTTVGVVVPECVPVDVVTSETGKMPFDESLGFIAGSPRDIKVDSVEFPKPPVIERFPAIKAEFPGGMRALMKYLNENINYPIDNSIEGVSGTVIVEFVVKTDSTVDNVTVKRGLHPSLDNEAIRVVKSMPKWKPATTENGVAISSYFLLPIQFKN